MISKSAPTPLTKFPIVVDSEPAMISIQSDEIAQHISRTFLTKFFVALGEV
jgi:hypothetical protein